MTHMMSHDSHDAPYVENGWGAHRRDLSPASLRWLGRGALRCGRCVEGFFP